MNYTADPFKVYKILECFGSAMIIFGVDKFIKPSKVVYFAFGDLTRFNFYYLLKTKYITGTSTCWRAYSTQTFDDSLDHILEKLTVGVLAIVDTVILWHINPSWEILVLEPGYSSNPHSKPQIMLFRPWIHLKWFKYRQLVHFMWERPYYPFKGPIYEQLCFLARRVKCFYNGVLRKPKRQKASSSLNMI